MKNLYSPCKLCQRNCGVDRLAGEVGFCGETAVLRIGAAVIHKGEEPSLVGTGGSGTIFISGCNLGCSFCQNYQISQGVEQGEERKETSLGKAVSAEDFADICIELCNMGAENINIVTGSHAIPALVEGIKAAKKKGMTLPFLWNSSGYETCDSLELLRDYIDIYLPDLKTLDSDIAEKFFNAPDYPASATTAILKMIDMTAKKSRENAREKVIIRHLILPGYLKATRAVLLWFADNAKDRALLSLMTQYTPIPNRKRAMPERYLSEDEYETVLKWLEELKIDEGFCQELVTGNDWLPDFKRHNPFSSELSVPVARLFTSQT
ncbi:MAG: radical SAM protein [Treponema sp.]|jgi:putative pyruvate formate lyase activating enzyme|nr:radical SAM protein [Treponema sp.]